MIPSSSEPFSSSPINRVPYDVLSEIFVHCLRQVPLTHRDPSPTMAPMLLCHICSAWRTAALASATLWSRLSYCLSVYYRSDSIYYRSDFGLLMKEIDCFRWWRKNHGQIAPFLRLTVQCHRHEAQELAEDGMKFLLEYITSAQYLNLNSFYWERLLDEITEVGNEFVFPNLHTIAESGWGDIDYFYRVQYSLPLHSLMGLRRLSLMDMLITRNSLTQAPIHWSTLTRLSLRNAEIILHFWFSLIRTVPNLQWAYVDISNLHNLKDYTEPPKCTLLQLSELCIVFRDEQEAAVQFAFSGLFSGLHLPAVRTLSLSWFIRDIWLDKDIVSELYTVLKSTPAITTLALANDFSLLINPVTSPMHHTASDQVDPVWNHAQHLVDLQVELSYPLYPDFDTESRAEMEGKVDSFIRKTLCSDSEGTWLDLRHPACPIRTLTIVDCLPPWGKWVLGEGSIGNFVMSIIGKHAKKSPNVTFRFTSESIPNNAVGVSNEWGSNI